MFVLLFICTYIDCNVYFLFMLHTAVSVLFVLCNSHRGEDLDYQTDPVSVMLTAGMNVSASVTTVAPGAGGSGTLLLFVD